LQVDQLQNWICRLSLFRERGATFAERKATLSPAIPAGILNSLLVLCSVALGRNQRRSFVERKKTLAKRFPHRVQTLNVCSAAISRQAEHSREINQTAGQRAGDIKFPLFQADIVGPTA